MAPRDHTWEHLLELDRRIFWPALILVWMARASGYPVIITSSRRSQADQDRLVDAGLSRDPNSPHLRGLAFDIDWYRTDRNDVPNEFWWAIGPWAEEFLGLTWGGRFTLWDPGHFEKRVIESEPEY